jgi:WD40 repeat protein
MIRCPSPDHLKRLLADELSGPEAEVIEAHLEGCAGCQQALERLTAARAATPPAATDPGETFLRRLGQGPPGPAGDGEALTLPPGGGGAAGLPSVPGYEVLGELGRGGMGVVYRARDTRLGRVVALKVVLAGSHAAASERSRFRAEAEAVARLQHPHVVQVFEVGEHAGVPFMALEFCAGGSLAAWLAGTPLPPRAAAALVERLARAVQAAHEAGIIHRDLKPANVLLAPAPRGAEEGAVELPREDEPSGGAKWVPKVSDFGLAKRLGEAGQTATGAVMGTPSYLAPEQAAGKKDVGPPADVYSLGAVLYECLTGRPPFTGPAALETLQQVLADDPVPPSGLQPRVPRDVETVCLKCLRKDPQGRYATAADLADDLGSFLAGEPIRARPVGALERARKWVRRRPTAAALLAVSAAAAVALLAGGVLFTEQVQEARGLAEQQRDRALRGEAEATEQRNAARQEWERAEREKADAARQLDLARRRHFTTQLVRVAGVWERDPVEAADLLEDVRACPPDLHDFAWGCLYRLCKRQRLSYPHVFGVDGVALSPDGKTLASASADGVLRLWDLPTDRERASARRDGASFTGLAFSPDGAALASGGLDGVVRLWDPAVGQERASFAAPSPVLALAYSPDGKALALGGKDGAVRLCDPATGKERAALKGHAADVYSVAFSPDGAALASAGGPAAAGQVRPGVVKLWDVATATEKAVLTGHPAEVYGVAFSPDGKTLASGGAGPWNQPGVVKVWDPATGKELRSLVGPRREVWALAFTPDGTRLAAGGGGTEVNGREIRGEVKFYEVLSGQERLTLKRHTGGVQSLCFSADGRLLAAGSGGVEKLNAPLPGEVTLWDVPPDRRGGDPAGPVPAQESATLPGHTATVRSVAFSADGKTLLSGPGGYGDAGDVRLWDPAARRELQQLRIPPGARTAAALAADGRTVALGNGDGTVLLWDAAAGQERATLKGHPAAVTCLAFSPDGRLLASGAKGLVGHDVVILWDAGDGHELARLPVPADVSFVGFSADGRTLASATRGEVRLWDVPGRRPHPGRKPYATSPVTAAALSPDGKRLAVNSGLALKVWDAEAGKDLATLPAHPRGVTALAFSPDGRTLASGSGDGVIRLWDVTTGEQRGSLAGHAEEVAALAFAAGGKVLASGGADRTVRLWETAPGREYATLRPHAGGVTGVAWSPDGATLATSGFSDRLVKLQDAATGRELAALAGHTGFVTCVAYGPDGKALASGGADQVVRLWDVATGQETAALPGHRGAVLALAFAPSGAVLASAGEDGTLRRWDLAPAREGVTFTGHAGKVTAVAFSPDGQVLASGGEDKTVRLWDAATGRERAVLKGHAGPVTCVAFAAGGRLLASAGDDQTVRLWDPATGHEVRSLAGHSARILGLAVTADGRTLASASEDRTVRLWDVATGQEHAVLHGHGARVVAAAFRPDGRVLATAAGWFNLPGEVKLWEVPPLSPEAP